METGKCGFSPTTRPPHRHGLSSLCRVACSVGDIRVRRCSGVYVFRLTNQLPVAPLAGTRDLHRLAILRDRAARQRDAPLGEFLHEVVVAVGEKKVVVEDEAVAFVAAAAPVAEDA